MLKYDPNESEIKLLPEGEYSFQMKKEPDKRKNENGKIFFIISLTAKAPDGSLYRYSEIFAPWEERWKDFLVALGGKEDEKGVVHLSETETVGKEFQGKIKTIWDEKNKKNRQRIVDIHQTEFDDIPEPNLNAETSEDDIPF